MKRLGLCLVALVLSIFVGLFQTKVIMSVSTLYEVTFLVELGFLKLYGLLAIVGLVLYKDKDSENTVSDEEGVTKLFSRIFTRAFLYLAWWGLAFLMYSILA